MGQGRTHGRAVHSPGAPGDGAVTEIVGYDGDLSAERKGAGASARSQRGRKDRSGACAGSQKRCTTSAKSSEGDVLVTDKTDPDWEPIMKKAAAIVTNRGGRTCHAAIVSRELGLPAIVGTENATEVLKDGQPVTVSCAEGEIGFVYEGLLKFDVEQVKLHDLPRPKTKVMMNVGNPEEAFRLSLHAQRRRGSRAGRIHYFELHQDPSARSARLRPS